MLQLGIYFIAFIAPTSTFALSEKPSWFPKHHCRAVWGKSETGHFYPSKEKSYLAFIQRLNRKNCFKTWTVLIYMAADNDLAPYAYWDLYEMEAAWSPIDQKQMNQDWTYFNPHQSLKTNPITLAESPNIKPQHLAGSTVRTDLLVQLDSPGAHGIKRLHIFENPKTYDLNLDLEYFKNFDPDNLYSPVIPPILPEPEKEESKNAHKKRFLEFLDWGIREYPSQHYLVIVWGHGQGFTSGVFKNRKFGGIAFDETQDTYLGITALRNIFKLIQEYTFEKKRGIDLYASDACLMQMAEVASHLSYQNFFRENPADTVRFIVGSEQIQDYLGLPYRNLFYILNTRRFKGTKDWNKTQIAFLSHSTRISRQLDEPYLLAQVIPKTVKRSFNPNHGLQGKLSPTAIETMTMSSISTAALQYDLLPQFHGLAFLLNQYLEEDFTVRQKILIDVFKYTPFFKGSAQDMGLFISEIYVAILEESEKKKNFTQITKAVLNQISNLRLALNKTVLAYELGTRYESQKLYLAGLRGLAFWVPRNLQDYKNRIQDLSHSWFFKYSPHWQNLLSSLILTQVSN